MTLLSTCEAVATEIKLMLPTSVVGNPEPDVQTLFRLANRVGNALMKAYPWQALREERTFTSLATEAQTGVLPADFDRIVAETFWNRTDRVLLSGPASPVQWQGLKANSYTDVSLPKFAYRGDAILILPTIAAGKTLAFEYVKNTWCASDAAAPQSSWLADTDVGVIDEELIIRGMKFVFLTDEGLPNGSAGSDFNDYFGQITRNEMFSANILVAGDIFGGGRHFAGAPPVNGDAGII